MGTLNLPVAGSIYLDASPVIYSVEKIDPYWSLLQPLWQTASSGAVQLIGSELPLLETLVKPVQNGDKILEKTFRELLTNPREVELFPISLDILEQAVHLRAMSGLKMPDAIHAATALQLGCQLFLTNDPIFRRVPGLTVSVLKDIV
jgi:predicted nucleic acid-binding protein